jgi:hypothetical protein
MALNNMRGSLGASLTDAGYNGLCHLNVIMTDWLSQQLDDEIILQFLLLFLPLLLLCAVTLIIWELVAFRFIQGLVVVRT